MFYFYQVVQTFYFYTSEFRIFHFFLARDGLWPVKFTLKCNGNHACWCWNKILYWHFSWKTIHWSCVLEHGSFDPACTGFLNIPDPTGKHSYCSHQNRRLQWNLCLLPSHGENMLYHCEALTILTPVRTQPRISVPGSIHIYVEPLFVSTIIDIIHFPAF